MPITVAISETFHCATSRAFKAPILGDATKFLDGFGFQPPIVAFREDETWGQANGIRYPLTEGNWFTPAGVLLTDQILERMENKYWKWTIFDFRPPSLFFANRAIGEWEVQEIENHQVRVRYAYTFYPKNWLYYLITWVFCQTQWKGMMKRAMKGIKKQAESDEQFIYETINV